MKKLSIIILLLIICCLHKTILAKNFTDPLTIMNVIYDFGGTHIGTDLDADAEIPVYAIADGIVFYYKSDAEAYGGGGGIGCNAVSGEVIFIRHQKSDGSYFIAQYGHIQNVPIELQYSGFNLNGPKVTQGQQIAEIGVFDPCRNCTERCDHLHFGIWDSEEFIPTSHWGYNVDVCWDEPLGCWVDPIWFLDNEFSYTNFSCSYSHQIPNVVYSTPLYEPTWYLVAFKNEGNSTWYNDPIAHPNDYVELKACDINGDVLFDGSSSLYYKSWKNLETPCSMQQTSVAPGETATFVFIGQAKDPNGDGTEDVYFRPNHSSGGLMEDWAGMHFQLDIQDSWFATIPLADCDGPSDFELHKWYQTDYVVLPGDWTPVTLPNSNWGCNNCDRFYRYWYNYEGTKSGQGVSIHFSSDDAIEVWVNGVLLGSWGSGCHASGCVNGSGCATNYSVPDIDITSYLHQGENLITAHVSDRYQGEKFDMIISSQALNITDDAICCLGDQCQEITGLYTSTTCISEGGTVYVGDWFDCGTFSSCSNVQLKGRGDPTLFFQAPAPVSQSPDVITFNLIDTLPRSSWYDLPEDLGGYRLYVSDYTGNFTITSSFSTNPDTLNILVTDYNFECPSAELAYVETGINYVQLDTSVATVEHGTYCISTGMVDVTVNTIIFNDLYPESSPIRSRSQIRGHIDSETGVLVVGSESYNVLPGAVLVPGDVNADGVSDISDLVYIVDFIFTGGSSPIPILEAGDFTCDGYVDISDLVFLVTFIFLNGEVPCSHF